MLRSGYNVTISMIEVMNMDVEKWLQCYNLYDWSDKYGCWEVVTMLQSLWLKWLVWMLRSGYNVTISMIEVVSMDV